MLIDAIDTIDGFESLRTDWNAAFHLDSHAGPFRSWVWHRGWLEQLTDEFVVLAARRDIYSSYVGFLPLSLRGSSSTLRIDHLREVRFAGEPVADEAGFICRQDYEVECIEAFGRFIADELAWDRLRFEEMNDPRMQSFVRSMPRDFQAIEHQGTPCPCIALPSTWDAYLHSMTSSTRQSLRRRIKTAEREFSIRVRAGNEVSESFHSELTALADRRTRSEHDPNVRQLSGVLQRCAEAGFMRAVEIRSGEALVAGVAGFMDDKRNAWCLWITSFDEKHSDFSPGRVAVALAIQDAIACGFTTFDFLRGEEPYKFQFGAVSRHNRTLVIRRPTLRASLNRRVNGMREALKR